MRVSNLEAINSQQVGAFRACKALLWHFRLDHASQDYLERAKNQLPDLKGLKGLDEIKNCLDCKLAKAKHQPFNQERTRATRPFQVIESDIAGPITPVSIKTKSRYYVTLTDNYSRFAMGYDLFNKLELHIQFENYLKDMREFMNDKAIKVEKLVNINQGASFTCKIGRLHTNNGTEYKTKEMKELLRRENIKYDPCNPHTPQHNGISERLNFEISEKVQTNLLSAGMPLSFWGYAMEYVLYV